jgi:exodeoxyribonuclease V beta subunit
MASTAHEILNLLNKGYSINGKKINPGDIAVLVSRHSEADKMQAVLKLKKVPSVLNSKISVFNSRIARDLYLTLHALSNAANEQLIRAALGTELFGYNPKKLLDLVHDEIAWSNTRNRFSEANSIWHQRNFGYAIDFIISAFSIDKNLLEKESGLRDLTNIHHLLELLNKEELRGSNSPSALLGYFRKKMEPGAVQSEEDEIRLETDAKAVQIVTMHASKGLEYPIVFCPFLWRESSNQQNPFFTISNGKQLLMNVDPESEQYQAFAAQRREEEYSEKIRLTYVALTRAKSACFVHWYKQNKGVKSAINHLIDANSVQQSDASAQKKIHWKKAETSASTYLQRSEKQYRLTETKPFNRKGIQNFPRVLSYSSLAEKLHKETDANNAPGFDDDELLINNVVSSLADEETIFSLPRGKLTGNLVHAIFENIDFQNAATYEVQITEQLMKHRFDEKWKHVLKKLVTDSLQHDLALGLKLGDIPQYQRITEMQFYFQVEGIQSSRLIKMIRRQAAHQNQNQFGTLTGFIDLVFEYNGQFYVLDYKSNFLGDNNADYSAEAIRAEMIHANYDLQYHIYALALHRYLAANLQDYEYKKHFGGVIYLFLRGIDPGRPLSGVFSDKPDLELILKLDEYMKGESHAS